MAAELDDPDLERDARARRGLLEQQRDRAARRARATTPARLEREGAVQQRRELAGRELGAVEEMHNLRVLTWNLYHGRTGPPCPVATCWTSSPPRSPAGNGTWRCSRRCRRGGRRLRRGRRAKHAADLAQLAAATAALDLARTRTSSKSSGGGSNAILVRGAEILEHRAVRLRRRPEGGGCTASGWPTGWSVNVHSQNHPEALALADTRRRSRRPRARDGAPLIFGGDVNLKRPPEFPGLVHLGGNHVDHLFTDGRPAAGREVLDRGALSDHPPVAVTLAD